MNEKKNENEKVMKYINNKLKEGEIPLMLQSVYLFSKSVKQEAKLVITSSNLYIIQNMNIKKYVKIALIQCVAVTPFSNQLIIFYDPKGDQTTKDSIRVQSQANFKIIQDIISVRQRFCEMKQQLPVIVSSNKYLQTLALVNQSTSKSKIFGFLFKKKQQKRDISQRFSGEGQILYVNQQNFALQIGQKMYNHIYKNVKLLYISNSQNFRFFQERYDVQQLSTTKRLFRLSSQFQQKQSSENQTKKRQKKNVLMRKIGKKSKQQDKQVADALKSYKNQQYKQQLLFAIETQTHFEILTALYEGERDCQSLIIEHEYLSQKDLRSIFFKLVEMIDSSSQIFYSLSPENIIVGKHGFRISKIFSCLKRRAEIDYLAPQQFFEQNFNATQIQLINLWKVGILLFQLAFGNVPFNAEFMADFFKSGSKQIELRFPFYILRTQQFQNFIKSILRIQPKMRGIIGNNNEKSKPEVTNTSVINWRSSLMKSLWLKCN